MRTSKKRLTRSSKADRIFQAFIFELFKVYARLNSAGDDVSKEFGLSSARWRVLGSACQGPKTVSSIARERGLTRQSVQQTVNSLLEERLVTLIENKDHKSAKLVSPTQAGKRLLLHLNDETAEWRNSIANVASESELETTIRVLEKLRLQIEKVTLERIPSSEE